MHGTTLKILKEIGFLRRIEMVCEHDNCFTCPYPDCISDTEPMASGKGKPGRKKMNPEEVRQHRLEYQRRYNQEHKEKIYAQKKAEKRRGIKNGKNNT